MDTIESGHIRDLKETTTLRETTGQGEEADSAVAIQTRSVIARWLLHDSPYIAMLMLAVGGVALRLPVGYWVILMPVFAAISIADGWQHFDTGKDRFKLVYGLAANWGALLLAVYLLFNGGVSGEMNANSVSLAMMTLLALGTFSAGVLARSWRMCTIGAILFLAVPALGWLDQSPLLIVAAFVMIIVLGGATWWLTQWWNGTTAAPVALSK